ncbi:MAG: DNRLRE domain-containing protein, partial [Candidatus Zixiibacteriota bacterium]
INVSNACIISPGNDSLSSRVLFKFDLPSKLSDKRIDYAEVVFKASIDTLSRHSVMFAGYPVTTEWSGATASWSGIWTNEGGDYNDSLYEIGLIKSGSDGVVRFDITRLVRSWQQNSMSNYGLIIIPVEEERRITKLVHPFGFPQGVFAKVIIYFSYTHP